MAEISVVVNKRSYKLACDDGEEEHLEELASYLDTQVIPSRVCCIPQD